MSYRIYHHSEDYQGIITPEFPRDPWDVIVDHDEIFSRYWDQLVSTFPDYSFYICDENDYLMASATATPLFFEGDLQLLPKQGWRWAIETAIQQADQGIRPNLVSALGIHVMPAQRGKGLSQVALKTLRTFAQSKGFSNLIAPVRPSQKYLYPLIPMEQYITWQTGDGLFFDAWLRTHQKLGAHVLKVADESVLVKGSISDWEQWTGLKFLSDGEYVVNGTLNPIQIDLQKDCGIYLEPNVWMVHSLP